MCLFSYGLAAQREEVSQLRGGHLGQPVFAAAHDALGQFLLLLDHQVDTFFKRADAYEFVNLHVLALADAEGAVGGLVLDGGVPPAIIVKHVIGRRQVESHAAGLQREDEEWRAAPFLLETLHYAVAQLLGSAAVQEQYLAPQRLLEI